MRAELRSERAVARGGRSRRCSAIAAVLLILAVVLAACSDSGSDSSAKSSGKTSSSTTEATSATTGGDATAQNASTQPAGAEAAILGYLKTQGIDYVGDCADAQLPADKGKWCSTLKSSDTTAGTETYDIGPVGEKPQKAITLKRKGA
ncbi:MAG: hypothetical protein ABUL47_06655, partial [Leifsonia sp.]